jgi:hypothetical protein
MPIIGHRVSAMPKNLAQFNTSPTGSWQDRDFSWAELVHAAITVGRESWAHVFWFGRPSSLEVAFRAALLRSSVVQAAAAGGRWVASPVYGGSAAQVGVMDASEKAAVSYFLGSTLACAFMRRTLGIRWTLHQSIYVPRFAVRVPLNSSRSRPDFIAFDRVRGLWYQLETKGRSSRLGPKGRAAVIESAKSQACAPLRFAGVRASLHLVSVADLNDGDLRVDWQDPDEEHEEPLELDVEPSGFVLQYYRTLAALLPANTQPRVIRGRMFVTADIPEVDLAWGIDAQLVDAAREGMTEGLLEYEPPAIIDEDFIQSDGVWIGLGTTWADTASGSLDNGQVRDGRP